jgi:hypothetical protein
MSDSKDTFSSERILDASSDLLWVERMCFRHGAAIVLSLAVHVPEHG